ncbi:TetR/AcrR family transcriptional regulator [Lapidilactobacillus wuchangensis]|uniref:TetR/AcrR family transcriptional regulator n=1 Tax=Lapidilactobacillus wuchangensis TaxID=2486001 RepID=UPI000F78CEFF|nr:TetR/AcrR family transcriptional regulator [Lapidilactobacillus wuchangensis]
MKSKDQLIIKFNHIILIQGFTDFSMVELAKKAGISRAKLYLDFKNKTEIVTAVVQRHLLFIEKNPVPNLATSDNLLVTILNSLLLMGATTERFEQELKLKYPQLYRQYTQADQQYFADLSVYYQQAQSKKLLNSTVSAEYLLFQNRLNVRGILAAVQTGQITLEQGESYLRAGISLQLQIMTVDSTQLVSGDLKEFEQRIINEYYDTYSLITR